jgi:outer membrane protein TolC
MKDLIDLKKLWLIFSLIITSLSADSELDNYLSERKSLLFGYEDSISYIESDMLKRDWINPIMMKYYYIRSNQFIFQDSVDKVFNIAIEQPIFKSGGIFYSIRYANLSKSAKLLGIYKEKRGLIIQLLDILYDLKKIELQKRQLELIIKNDEIDIRRKRDQFQAGAIDSSFLDQAIIKRNQDKTRLLALELDKERLKNSFRILSDKNPDRLKVPHLKLISKSEYVKNHLDIKSDSIDVDIKSVSKKMTLSKYLPSVSFIANYYDIKSNHPEPMIRDRYHDVGFVVSVPIDINAPAEIEKSKLEYLKSKIQLQDDLKRIKSEYELAIRTIRLIDKKIALAKSDEKLYKNLLKFTREQFKAGNKTELDVLTIKNSLKLSKLDRLIYQIERQKQILKLYEKVKK